MKKTPRDLDEGTIRRIDWQELCPGVLLLRAFPITANFRVLSIASLGVLLSLFLAILINAIASQSTINHVNRLEQKHLEEQGQLEQSLSGKENFVPGSLSRYEDLFKESQRDQVDIVRIVQQTRVPTFPAFEKPSEDGKKSVRKGEFPIEAVRLPSFYEALDSFLLPWTMLSESLCRVVPLRSTFSGNALAFTWFLGTLGIWTLCGAVIMRTAATQLTVEQYSRWSNLQKFLNWRIRSYFSAVLIPLAGLLFCGSMVWLAGKILLLPVVNYVVAIAFPIVLFFGFCFALLGIGQLFSWPLAFAAVSVDGSDGFDAVSRSYSYVYQRPLHYFVYAFLGILVGLIGWYFVSWIVDLVLMLVKSWGGVPLFDFALLQGSAVKSLDQAPLPHRIIFFWCWCFQMIKVGFVFGYFWVCSTTIYLILRRSVDGTPFDEIGFPKDDQPFVQNAPEMQTDEKDVPQLEN